MSLIDREDAAKACENFYAGDEWSIQAQCAAAIRALPPVEVPEDVLAWANGVNPSGIVAASNFILYLASGKP